MATKFTYTRRDRDNFDPPLTVAAISAIVRESRDYGRYAELPCESTYPCPLDVSRYGTAHRVRVHHAPYGEPACVEVLAAFREHLTEDDDETRCCHVTRRTTTGGA